MQKQNHKMQCRSVVCSILCVKLVIFFLLLWLRHHPEASEKGFRRCWNDPRKALNKAKSENKTHREKGGGSFTAPENPTRPPTIHRQPKNLINYLVRVRLVSCKIFTDEPIHPHSQNCIPKHVPEFQINYFSSSFIKILMIGLTFQSCLFHVNLLSCRNLDYAAIESLFYSSML